MFAAHHRLDALTAVIDVNGQQALGRTSDVLDLDHLAARWHAFGWAVTEVDGHSRPALRDALLARHGRPHVILAKTTFGRGVSFMERGEARDRGLPPRPHNWHYLSMSAREFEIASRELEAAPEDGVL